MFHKNQINYFCLRNAFDILLVFCSLQKSNNKNVLKLKLLNFCFYLTALFKSKTCSFQKIVFHPKQKLLFIFSIKRPTNHCRWSLHPVQWGGIHCRKGQAPDAQVHGASDGCLCCEEQTCHPQLFCDIQWQGVLHMQLWGPVQVQWSCGEEPCG